VIIEEDLTVLLNEQKYLVHKIQAVDAYYLSQHFNIAEKEMLDFGDNFYVFDLVSEVLESADFVLITCNDSLFVWAGGTYSNRGIYKTV